MQNSEKKKDELVARRRKVKREVGRGRAGGAGRDEGEKSIGEEEAGKLEEQTQ